MSKSLMDAIRQAITEGARDKTSDGMTKDAKHFAQELHRVQDAGYKHMVQKDSETKDYEKMFSGDVEKAPTRPADLEPGQDLDKYVEYNEEKKHSKGCGCDACKKKVDVSEIYAVPGTPAGSAYQKQLAGNVGKPALPLQAGQRPPGVGDAGQSGRVSTFKAPAPVNKTRAQAAAPSGIPTWGTQKGPSTPAKPAVSPMAGQGAAAPGPKSPMAGQGAAAPGPKSPMAGQGAAKPSIAKPAAPAAQAAKKPASAAKAPAPAKVQTAKPAAGPKPVSGGDRLQRIKSAEKAVGPQAKSAIAKTSLGVTTTKAAPARKAPAGTNVLRQSYDIEWNGKSYVMNEAQVMAMNAFIEKYGVLDEMTPGEFISKEMKHPEKLTAKTKAMKVKQAFAIYKSKERRGEKP